ncbi:MAG: type II toxin-antitoxin system PemK/MazF family toxin [Ignavibacteriae bacterium]|nr:type II toxin-antitoxin system PemK/MazF family toxin [Ignavibacteriota bacterium]
MRRGEVWLINLDPTIGAEIKKIRPAIIVNNDDLGILPLKIIVPVTEWKERYDNAPWMVNIHPVQENGLEKESAADTFQVRSISQERFVRKLGIVSSPVMKEISSALSIVLCFER